MGQYYMPCIMAETADGYQITSYYSHDYNNGLKLMEHSYIGNRFADKIMDAIRRAGTARFAHIGDYWGDYVSDNGFPNKDCALSDDELTQLCKDIWDDRYTKHPRKKLTYEEWVKTEYVSPYDGKNVYANNLDKEESVSFLAQPEIKGWDGVRINPLMLLCAVGNDYGGGDFHKGEGYDDIGRWAFDRIKLTTGKPLFEEPGYEFVEEY